MSRDFARSRDNNSQFWAPDKASATTTVSRAAFVEVRIQASMIRGLHGDA
jgi:hypothetical protein